MEQSKNVAVITEQIKAGKRVWDCEGQEDSDLDRFEREVVLPLRQLHAEAFLEKVTEQHETLKGALRVVRVEITGKVYAMPSE